MLRSSSEGRRKGCRECHINPDWLLVYRKDKKELILYLIHTGTHSDLFNA
ncbi:MAG: type II toxin-antitoxin system mRNA interferase toxin, RelE/StbE family [Synergistaceae bacterium]|nr:type II toxin-antitoxin system mRNA interferase toxin, RelE/StbE family [Synergistaceae bacterium]